MKKLYAICAAILMTASVFAQAPEKMSYQAVIRDSGDNLVISQLVGMQISILQGSASGTAVYIETQTLTTNTNGLVTLEIGTGAVVSGDFKTIDWSIGSYFIKTEIDPAGGANYTITGISQLLSVPYALHAKTAENVVNSKIKYVSQTFQVQIPGTSASISAGFELNYNVLTVNAAPNYYIVSGGFRVVSSFDRAIISEDIISGDGQQYFVRLINQAPESRSFTVTLTVVQINGPEVEFGVN